jgi:hypothetical protein
VPSAKIPKEIQQFAARFLPSVAHLETFVLLLGNTARFWSAEDVAAAVGIAVSAAADVLEQLASDNFLDVKISNEILYRFNPATPALETRARECADLYRHERIAMINFVTVQSLKSMHDFAEAFRLKKGKNHG